MTDATADKAFSPDRFFNRELSWLDFNQRVLALAGDESVPLLERLSFCGIWASNLDEFFQVRIAGLLTELDQGGTRSADGMTSADQLSALRDRILQEQRQVIARHESLLHQVSLEGQRVVRVQDLNDEAAKSLEELFTRKVFPVLTPLAVDPGHPFPYISNLSLSLGVLVAEPDTGLRVFARVKVPVEILGRYVRVPDGTDLVRLEDLMASHLDQLFPGMTILSWAAFRVTRSADVVIDDSAVEDLLSAVESEVRQRQFGDVVRLEITSDTTAEMRDLLVEELEVSDGAVYESDGPLDIKSASSIPVSDRPDLRWQRWEPRIPSALVTNGPKEFFGVLRKRDVLVHHPYQSFEHSVQEFVTNAANDHSVLAIKLTLYRTSGDGHIVEALIRAAESGKQVVVVVELKARFDEQANITWARRLERAGAHVAYGLIGLKVHSKVALVVRTEADGELRRYCHVGTGNYNAKTARGYTDFGLLTTDESIGLDLSNLFNSLTGYGAGPTYQRLVVAPRDMRPRLIELIRNEAALGSRGRIVAKMNSLVDPELIEELYAASQAGVTCELIVRGICCLRPKVPGLSDNITVRSIVGRYLEHSRMYVFANGENGNLPLYLIGSADLMPRNLDRRVEVLVPIRDANCQDEIERVLAVNLADNDTSWILGPDGQWTRRRPPAPTAEGDAVDVIRTHVRLQELAAQ